MHAALRMAPPTQTRSGRRLSVVRVLLAAAAALAIPTLAVMGSAGGSLALWNGGATANAGAVSAGFIQATQTINPPLTYTYRSGQVTTTGALVVGNSGNVPAAVTSTLTLAVASSAGMAAVTTVDEWPAASASACTPAATVPSGAWSGSASALAAPGLPVTSGTLAAGASLAFCVRTAMTVTSAPGVASGSALSFSGSTTLSIGTAWSSTASANAAQTFVDDIAPSAPTALSVPAGPLTSAALAWRASSDNVGVTAYRIFRNGVLIATVTAPTVTYVDALVPPGKDTYAVSAVDAIGNVSSLSLGAATLGTFKAATAYQVSNPANGLCAQMGTSGIGSVTDVACASPTPAGQQWVFTAVGNNWDIASGGQSVGTWKLAELNDGNFTFTLVGSSTCLTASAPTSPPQLTVSTCVPGNAAQEFSLAFPT